MTGPPMLPAEVARRGAAAAEALADLHGAGRLHGSLTPGFLIADGTSGPVLPDGSDPAIYTAPEITAGGPSTELGDVHALASVCWHALTGVPPPPPDRRHLEQGRLREPVAAALLTALEPDPTERTPTAVRLRDDLVAARRAVVDGGAPRSREDTTSPAGVALTVVASLAVLAAELAILDVHTGRSVVVLQAASAVPALTALAWTALPRR